MARAYGIAELIIGKQRHGATGKVKMKFEAKITRDRAARIDPKSIKDFADTRYIRLFDNVVRN